MNELGKKKSTYGDVTLDEFINGKLSASDIKTFEDLVYFRKLHAQAEKVNDYQTKKILSGLYNDASHFVYEILQNAEDVKAKTVRFVLKEGELEIWHDGNDFNFDNVKAITGIGLSTKEKDLTAIGKFGVGFKSVFAITTTPIIRSGPYHIKIVDFVVPEPLEQTTEKGTFIELIFNHPGPERTSEKLYDLIKKRLNELGLETLMFLTNINRIECVTDGHSDTYSRKVIETDDLKWVTLEHMRDDKNIKTEEWLVIGRNVGQNEYILEEIEKITSERKASLTEEEMGKLKVEIAFSVMIDERGKKHIECLDANRPTLSAYFLTTIRTGLHFIIQGPYRTTPARDDVPFDEKWNRELINETANLVAESINKIKELNMLEIEFLYALPINKSTLENRICVIYERVKEKLSSKEELLPEVSGKYSSKDRVLIARGKELTTLLLKEQLEELFGKSYWLNSEITESGRYGDLWTYLTKELEIREIRPEDFIIALSKPFLEKQTDEWIINFYDYVSGKEKFWKGYDFQHDWKSYGSLKVMPIIRLTDDTHMDPFREKGEELVYLPTGDKNIDDEFDVVKNSIANNPRAMAFFEKLELKKPDTIARVHEKILPKYRPDNLFDRFNDEDDDIQTISIEENISDIKAILSSLKRSGNDERVNGIIDQMWECEFLLATNLKTQERKYVAPNQYIFINCKFTENEDIEKFYRDNEDAWLIDGGYFEHLTAEELRNLYCSEEIYIIYKKQNSSGYVVIDNSRPYKRGLDGFDPECEIFGLENALVNIDYEKSLLIWRFLKKHYEKISGIVEQSSRQDFSNTGRNYKKTQIFSTMGIILTEKSWLYTNRNSMPVKPSEISLQDLSSDYEKVSTARFLSEQLLFRTPLQEELKKKMTKDEWEWHDALNQANILGIKDDVLAFIKKRIESEQMKSVEKTPSKIAEEFETALCGSSGDLCIEEDSEQHIMPSLTPDEEEDIEKVHGQEIPKILKRIKIKTDVKTTTESKILDSIDVAQFLISEYDGHCQICNVRLFSGRKTNRRGGLEFMTTRLIETKNTHPYSDMEFNVLCLCPNHFALFKYGVKDPKGIWKIAKEISEGEKGPEFVEERGKRDYYIAKIYMMGEKGRIEETEIYYSQTHMRKIVALLKEANKEQE